MGSCLSLTCSFLELFHLLTALLQARLFSRYPNLLELYWEIIISQKWFLWFLFIRVCLWFLFIRVCIRAVVIKAIQSFMFIENEILFTGTLMDGHKMKCKWNFSLTTETMSKSPNHLVYGLSFVC